MKKQFLSFLMVALLGIVQVFSVVLPEGTNARVTDMKQDGDAIIEANLAQPTIIKTPVGELEVEGTVKFYKTGGLKSCYAARGQKIEIDIGTVELNRGTITFYSSGSLCYIRNVNKYELRTALGTTVGSGDLEFYNSGSSEKSQLRKFENIREIKNPKEVEKSKEEEKSKKKEKSKENAKKVLGFFGLSSDNNSSASNSSGAKTNEVKNTEPYYTCALGKFRVDRSEPCYQYPSGNMKSFKCSGKEYEIKTPLGSVFAEENTVLNFRDDGSIIGFKIGDLLQCEVAGVKVNIPSGSYVSFYPNGNICDFVASNSVSFTVGKREVQFREKSKFRASEDGKEIIECPSSFGVERNTKDGEYFGDGVIKEFYDNGIPKRYIKEDAGVKYGSWIDSGVRYEVRALRSNRGYLICHKLKSKGNMLFPDNLTGAKRFYLQSGDSPEDVGMVYFGEDGLPTGYSTYKYDSAGYILCDDVNEPVIDMKNVKQFVKTENTIE